MQRVVVRNVELRIVVWVMASRRLTWNSKESRLACLLEGALAIDHSLSKQIRGAGCVVSRCARLMESLHATTLFGRLTVSAEGVAGLVLGVFAVSLRLEAHQLRVGVP